MALSILGPRGLGVVAPRTDASDSGLAFLASALGQPIATATPPGSSPATSAGTTPFPTIPDFGLPDIAQITAALNQMTGDAFRAAAGSRIPGQSGLEQQSSAGIQQLLSPAEYFPGTSREAAEEASLRGIPGSGAADSTWVRRTREEQLREMGLGQQFFNAALSRNPIAPQYDPSGLASYMTQLPGQRAQLLTQQQQFAQQQQQQRDLAAAQMANAYRIAQLNALRSGSALGGRPSYNFGGFPQGGASPMAPRPFPMPVPTVTPSFSDSFPSIEALGNAFNGNLGFPVDMPIDIPIDFDALAEPESLYA